MAYERHEVSTARHDHPHTEYVEAVPAPRAAATIDQVNAVAYDPYANRRRSSYKMVSAVYLIFGLIETLIVIRFVLRILGANPDAGFAQFIYGITGGLVAPFVGLFGTPQAGGSVFEAHSIVALIVYALLGWLVAKVLWLAFGETRSAVTTASTSVDTHTR